MSSWRRKLWGIIGSAVIAAIAVSGCGTTPPPTVERKSDPVPDLSGTVQSLQRQVRERDKRIEELESQLNALKLIDQDIDKRRRPIRSPATLVPAE